MKRCVKTERTNCRLHDKTDFNDWNDPKCPAIVKKAIETPKKTNQADDKLKEGEETPKSVSSHTSLEIEDLRSKIKRGFALLTKKEIRTIKLPFYESLILNLKDDGFIGTYQFIKDLIELDEEYHILQQKDHSLKDRPFLKFDKGALKCLSKGLMEAELARKSDDSNEEIRLLLNLALHFSKPGNSSWDWLAEELFEQCVCYEETSNVNLSLQAISKHLFAKFILNTKNDLNSSKQYVEESMKLSEGKHWYASEVTKEKCDLLYFESCLLLHKILLAMAENVKNEHVEIAIQLCRNALHWAKTVGNKSAEASALMRLVSIYLTAEELSPVPDLLQNYMKLCSELGDFQGQCEGYILTAVYFELIENNELVVENIKLLLKTAEEHEIPHMMAIAHRNLATFYLMQGDEKEMLEHAIEAYNIFVKLNKTHEIEEARCLTGIAQAQELMAFYLHLLLEAEDLNSPEINILFDWQMLHIPFCTDVTLFHPESGYNDAIKRRIQDMQVEDKITNHQTRLNEFRLSPSSVHVMNKKRTGPSASVSSAKASILHFRRLIRSTSGSFANSLYNYSVPNT